MNEVSAVLHRYDDDDDDDIEFIIYCITACLAQWLRRQTHKQ